MLAGPLQVKVGKASGKLHGRSWRGQKRRTNRLKTLPSRRLQSTRLLRNKLAINKILINTMTKLVEGIEAESKARRDAGVRIKAAG